MGHQATTPKDYLLLQRQLDKSVVGAPYSPVFIKILQILFSPEQAAIARKLPTIPTSLSDLSRKLAIPFDELDGIITAMALKGLVFDVYRDDVRYVTLAPVVWGFFEFSYMRVRDDIPQAELAKLFEQYLTEDAQFNHAIFQKSVQMTRSLVHEEALPQDDHTEILDYERASYLVSTAQAHAVSTCSCRHKAGHLGKACDNPQEVCLILNNAAEVFTRQGFSRTISRDHALEILKTCREHGLAQSADNVQQNIAFICNCCGCCCELFNAIRRFNITGAIVSSNWIAHVDTGNCSGCGNCVEACPALAMDLEKHENGAEPVKYAQVNEEICVGCGVCYSACKKDAIIMKKRSQRVFTPETIFDKTVAMAIERGKLANYIFSDPQKLHHRALGRITGLIEHSPVFKAAMAVKPLKSAFLNTLVTRIKRNKKW